MYNNILDVSLPFKKIEIFIVSYMDLRVWNIQLIEALDIYIEHIQIKFLVFDANNSQVQNR